MTLMQFFCMENFITHGTMQALRSPVVCNDGYRVSIQASETHYCIPRKNGLTAYKEYELGFPNEEDEIIMEYAENPGDPMDTVYGYVPATTVEKLIEKHGGINEDKMLEEIKAFWIKNDIRYYSLDELKRWLSTIKEPAV